MDSNRKDENIIIETVVNDEVQPKPWLSVLNQNLACCCGNVMCQEISVRLAKHRADRGGFVDLPSKPTTLTSRTTNEQKEKRARKEKVVDRWTTHMGGKFKDAMNQVQRVRIAKIHFHGDITALAAQENIPFH